MSFSRSGTDRRKRWTALVALSAGLVSLLLPLWFRARGSDVTWATIESAVKGQRWVEAEADLERWLTRHPDDPRGLYYQGGVLEKLGRLDEAARVLGRVPRTDRLGMRVQVLLGEIALKQQDAPAAERAFLAAAEAEPTAIDPRRRLVFLYVLQQRHEEALTILRDLYRLTHDVRDLVTRLSLIAAAPDTRDLRPELEKFLGRTPGDPWLRRARGLMLLRLGEAPAALPDLEAAASALDDDPEGRLGLAECRLLLGRPEDAALALGAVPERADLKARWWLLDGRVDDAVGRPNEALSAWRNAVAADARSRDAHYRLGQALVRLGTVAEGRPHLDRAEELRAGEAILKAELDEVVTGKRSAERFERLSQLCLDAGFRQEGRDWLEQALTIDPSRPGLQVKLASLPRLAPPEETARSRSRSRPRLRAEPRNERPAPPVEPSRRSAVRPRFDDASARAGLVYRYNSAERGDLFIGDTMGGGVGLFDYDRDGWLDVYFVNGCSLPIGPGATPGANRLFRNKGDGTFADVTESAKVGGRGYGMGCAVGDYDKDGHDDLFVTGLGSTVLYRNRGDGTFEDVTDRAGVRSDRWATAAGFGDLDGDGDLDLVAVTYVAANPSEVVRCTDQLGKPIHCPPGRFPSQFDLLFRNDGDGRFTDVSKEAGLEVSGGDGLGLAIADLDGDGRLDLFVANDAAPDFLFRNLGGLKFEEVGVTSGVAYDGGGRATASMGVVADDLDGDGRLDLFHTNFNNEPNTLLRNLGGGQFVDATTALGLDAPSRAMTGFGTVALDADNDGQLDLFVANGHVDDQPWFNIPMAQRPQLYLARPRQPFVEAPAEIGPYFQGRYVGRGAAAGDLDNDGRVDLVVVHRDAPAVLLRNSSPESGHWVSLDLRGTKSGWPAVGARVTCVAGGRTIVRWVTSGTSYLSQNDPRLTFGLGASRQVERLEVKWPSGASASWSGVEADRFYEIREDQGPAPLAGRPAR